MKEKILAALKTKFQNFGFGDKAFDGVAAYLATTVTEDAQIETAITGVENLLKGFQSEADKLRGENQKLKKLITDPKTDEPKTDDNPKTSDSSEVATLLKAVVESNKKMAEQIQGLQAEKTAQTHMQKLVAGLKEKKIPESYYAPAIAGRNFKEESEVDAFLTTVTDAYGKYNQEQADKGLVQQPAPVMGLVTDAAKDVSPMMTEYLKQNKDQTKKTA